MGPDDRGRDNEDRGVYPREHLVLVASGRNVEDHAIEPRAGTRNEVGKGDVRRVVSLRREQHAKRAGDRNRTPAERRVVGLEISPRPRRPIAETEPQGEGSISPEVDHARLGRRGECLSEVQCDRRGPDTARNARHRNHEAAPTAEGARHVVDHARGGGGIEANAAPSGGVGPNDEDVGSVGRRRLEELDAPRGGGAVESGRGRQPDRRVAAYDRNSYLRHARELTYGRNTPL